MQDQTNSHSLIAGRTQCSCLQCDRGGWRRHCVTTAEVLPPLWMRMLSRQCMCASLMYIWRDPQSGGCDMRGDVVACRGTPERTFVNRRAEYTKFISNILYHKFCPKAQKINHTSHFFKTYLPEFRTASLLNRGAIVYHDHAAQFW